MKIRRRKCRHCHEWFLPQPHNAYHQRFCTDPVCRQASKRVSQRRWFRKNRDHFRGPVNSARVAEWRDAHPGYARGRLRCRRLLMNLQLHPGRKRVRFRIDDPKTGALQDLYFVQPVGIARVVSRLKPALQDLIGISAAVSYA